MRRGRAATPVMLRVARWAMILTGWLGATLSAPAQTVEQLVLPAPVERIVKAQDGVFMLTGTNWMKLSECAATSELCLEPAAAPYLSEPAPKGALLDGQIATAASGDIRKAWYARPTTRYGHGVLGDAIEAGALVVVDATGENHEIVLPDHQVFEDITPRIADLDDDGRNEVITIRASARGGAGVAVYGLQDGRLVLRAEGSENGRANRWLNIAGLVPRAGGGLTIYGVRTPHIGGRLFSLDFHEGEISELNDIALDVSNHLIGSRELGLSAVGVFDRRTELALPSQNRQRLRFPLSGRDDIALPGPIDKTIVMIDGKIVTATENGELIIIRP